MKNTLIVSLDQKTDLLQLTSLLTSLNEEQAQVTLLTLDQHSSVAANLPYLTHCQFIQLEEIIKYKKHRIFSDYEMVKELWRNIEPLTKITWDEVINISTSEAASYLVNCFEAKEMKGQRYTKERTLFSSSEINPWIKHKSSFSEADCISEISGRQWKEGAKLKAIDWSANQTLYNQGQNLEAKKQTKELVGLELASANENNHLSLSAMVELYLKLRQNPNYEVFVILNPENRLEKYVYELNEKVGGNLEVLEATKKDLAYLAQHFSFIFTTSLSLKTAAAIHKVRTLSLFTSLEDVYRHTSENSLSLYLSTESIPLLNGETIATILENYKSNNEQELLKSPKAIELYKLSKEKIIVPVSYFYNQDTYLKMIMEKALWKEIHYTSWIELKKYLKNIPDRELSQFVLGEKEALSLVVKSSLSAIRFLKNHEQGPNQVKELLTTLDQLMNQRVPGATHYLLNLFKHRMEHLSAQGKEDNLIKTDKALLTLKNQLSSLTKILGDMAETINERRKISLGTTISHS